MTTRHRALILVGVMAAAVLAAAPVVTAQAVAVTGVSPSSATQGTTSLNVTISGKNFKAGAAVAFYKTGTTDTGGVVVNQTTYKRAAQLIANITVGDNATIGSYDVVVQIGASLGTGVALFRVTAKAIDPCASALPSPTTGDTSGWPGSRDGTFGSNGVVIGPKFMGVAAMAIQDVGGEKRIVAVGTRRDTCADGYYGWTIMRYLTDGQLDTSFGSNGVATKTFTRGEVPIYAVAIDQSGRILIGGYRHVSTNDSYGFVARYTAGGQLDTTFAPDGVEPGIRSLSLERYLTEARAIAIQQDGKIVIAGTDGGAMAIFRLTADGAWDTAEFNGGAVRPQLPGRYVYVDAPSWAYGVAIEGNGEQQRIVVAGRRGVMRDDDTWDHDGAVWRFTTDGRPDPTFGASGVVTTGFDHTYDVFQAVAVDGSGRVVAIGSREDGSTPAYPTSGIVARYDVNGDRDSDFNSGDPIVVSQPGWTAHSLNALAIDSNDAILVGGSVAKRDAGGASVGYGAALWRFDAAGNGDPSFGSNGWVVDTVVDGGAYATWTGLAMQSNRQVVAAGSASLGARYAVFMRFWQ